MSGASREKIVVGNHVIGKSQAILGWIGTVKKITGEGLQKKFFVDWHNQENHPEAGEEFACYPKRAITLYSSRNANPQAVRASGRVTRPPRRVGEGSSSSDEGGRAGDAAEDADEDGVASSAASADTDGEGEGHDEDVSGGVGGAAAAASGADCGGGRVV